MEKTNFKKLVSLSLAAMLCASVPAISANGAFATDGAPAGGGEPVPVEDNSFVVEETAAIRVSDPAGMRFYANIGADLVDDVQSADEFGFLIFPHAYLAEDENAGKADWQVKGIDGNAEYGLWDYVKVSTTEMDGLIYQRETDGKYCVNGVLHTVVDETMEFAAIAYYVKDGEPVYADFNEDFSRSLSYVAKWAYLNEPTKRDMIETVFANWFDASEFTIDSGADLQRLSNVVRADNTLAGLNFTLSKTIAVDGSTFTPVPAEFAGEWNWNGRAILVIADEDPNTDDERAFVSDTYNVAAEVRTDFVRNGVAVRSAKLIDSAKTIFEYSNVTNELTFETQRGSVSGINAAYITIDAAKAGKQLKGYYRLKTNGWYTPKSSNEASQYEMTAIKELYSAVTFRIYVDNTKAVWNGGHAETILGLMGYMVKADSPVPTGEWIEKTFTIDQVMDISMNRNASAYPDTSFNTLPLGYIYCANGGACSFYVGDCVFVK